MKGFAIIALFGIAAAHTFGVTLALDLGQSVVAAIGNDQVEPGAPGGRAPVDIPTGTATANGGEGGGLMGEAALADALAKGGLPALLALVLFFYRRDFFVKAEKTKEQFELEKRELAERLQERKDEREQLEEIVEKSTVAITNSAIATARQTDATHRLARAVTNIERRQAGLAPEASPNPGSAES